MQDNEMMAVASSPRDPQHEAFKIVSDEDPTCLNGVLVHQMSSMSLSSGRDAECPKSPSTPQRRAIFNAFWEKRTSSSFIKEEESNEVKSSPKFCEPSYLGIYSFAPSPLMSPKPSLVVSPNSSSSSDLTPTPSRPRSILRRHHSLREKRVAPSPNSEDVRPSLAARPRSESLRLPFVPPLYQDEEASVGSRSSKASSERERGNGLRPRRDVHFDPTITVREVVGHDHDDEKESNWFSDHELGSFMNEAVNHCHSSAIDAMKSYSVPSVAKAYAAAHEAGVKDPVVSSTHPEYRALFCDPALHTTEEDSVVHDGSKKFFKIMAKEVQKVLIVDSSPTSLKLIQRNIMAMFPHANVDAVWSGEEALEHAKERNPKRALYDIIVVEERLQDPSWSLESNDNMLSKDAQTEISGSELLHLINDIETRAIMLERQQRKEQDRDITSSSQDVDDKRNGNPSSRSIKRQSLKIGVSVSLSEDCESLRKAGADLFWSKPPPKPSNGLRNQLLNSLLSKRGKSVFICGC